jgi:hypothetical protein
MNRINNLPASFSDFLARNIMSMKNVDAAPGMSWAGVEPTSPGYHGCTTGELC